MGFLILFDFIQIEKLPGGVLSERDASSVGMSKRAARWRAVRILRRGMRDCLCWSIVCLVQIPGHMNQCLARSKSGEVQLGQRAAIYAWVSTADQSCERQVSELTSFAGRCGYELAGIFRETAPGHPPNLPHAKR